MITQLYNFSPDAYVVADEWNGNFQVLYTTTLAHIEAIYDAYNVLAFPNSDLTDLFNVVKSKPDSIAVTGLDVYLYPDMEYYKVLQADDVLRIHTTPDMYGEARILFKLETQRTGIVNRPFNIVVDDDSDVHVDIGVGNHWNFVPGYYFMMIFGYDMPYEDGTTNHQIDIKLIYTGV